jgi:hypothetical protein
MEAGLFHTLIMQHLQQSHNPAFGESDLHYITALSAASFLVINSFCSAFSHVPISPYPQCSPYHHSADDISSWEFARLCVPVGGEKRGDHASQEL